MTKMKLCVLILVAAFTMTMRASEPSSSSSVQSIGVYMDNSADVGDDAVKVTANVIRDGVEVVDTVEARATVLRDGKEYAVLSGMDVFPGDVVSTPQGGGILVALLSNNLIELRESSTLTVGGDGKSADSASTITVNLGSASVLAKGVLADRMTVAMGDTNHPIARALSTPRAAPKPTALEIITKSNGAGGFITTVYVTAGQATLTPAGGGNPVVVTDGANSFVTINTPVTGVTNSAVVVTAAKFDKNNAVGALQTIIAKVGKGTIGYSATIINGDGSKSTGKFTTTTAGVVTKDAWKTAGANKFSESWSEDKLKGSISVKQTFDGNSFSAKFAGTSSPKSTLKLADKSSFTGVATYDPLTGMITFTGTSKTAGVTATFVFDPLDAAGQKQTVVKTTGGVAGSPITHVVPHGSPVTTTPDGRVIIQNSVPKSQ